MPKQWENEVILCDLQWATMTTDVSKRNATFWLLVVITVSAAFSPYYWDLLFRYHVVLWFKGHIALALGWTGLAFVTVRAGKLAGRRPYWVWLFLPVVLWPVILTTIIFVIWKLNGFAP